jgi:serine/threonine protein kinase
MENASPLALYPSRLPPGTQIGAWRVVGWGGRGVYGAVYRAVPVQDAQAPEVALKIALLPEDPRFEHEVELLGRVNHPSIPRLLGHGLWHSIGDTRHPYLVIQWVDGLQLYDQARLSLLRPAQVLRWLAQLASALEALHAQGAVHRDVKGGNVLVRPDGRAMLVDLGTGFYPGAATLTPPLWFPGTPAYRSPESWLFELQFSRDATARYRAGPADDLYALGVTACRLLIGEYPEPAGPRKDEEGKWHLDMMLPHGLLKEKGMEPRLRAFVLRMLAVKPEDRGSAAQLAEDLERAAELAEVSAPKPQQAAAQVPKVERASEASGSAADVIPPAPVQPKRHWRVLAAAGLALVVWTWKAVSSQPVAESSAAEAQSAGEGTPDDGPTGLGEAAAATSLKEAPNSSYQEALTEDSPPEPRPGQTRPDVKGRCPHKGQIALNKGCWLEISLEPERCSELKGQMFKGLCYLPFIPPGRPPTSSPTDKP